MSHIILKGPSYPPEHYTALSAVFIHEYVLHFQLPLRQQYEKSAQVSLRATHTKHGEGVLIQGHMWNTGARQPLVSITELDQPACLTLYITKCK